MHLFSPLRLPLTPPSYDHLLAAVQDGGCEHGNVGGGLQCHCTGAVHPQLEVLPVRLRGLLLHGTLPVPQANAMPLG
jgi:hypothetical protein